MTTNTGAATNTRSAAPTAAQDDGLTPEQRKEKAAAEVRKAIAAGSANDALKQHVRDGERAVEESVNAVADERALVELAETAVKRFDAFATRVTAPAAAPPGRVNA